VGAKGTREETEHVVGVIQIREGQEVPEREKIIDEESHRLNDVRRGGIRGRAGE